MKTILLAILSFGFLIAPAPRLAAVCEDPPQDPPVILPSEGLTKPAPSPTPAKPTPNPTPTKPNK
jgi:hypothetical protein